MNERLIVGLNVGGTHSSAVLGDGEGDLLDITEWDTHAEPGVESFLQIAFQTIRSLQTKGRIERIGVSIGGPVDVVRGIVLSPPHLPEWDRVPLKQRLEEEFQLPVHVEHDAAACCYAEYLWGAGKGAERLAYLTCGTGCGIGLVIDGEPYHGADGKPPEFGHVQLERGGPVSFGVAGSIDALCSAKALGVIASYRIPHRWAPDAVSSKDVAKLAHSGDTDALTVIDASASFVARACAIASDLLRLDRILLGSLATYLGEGWIEAVRQNFRLLALDGDGCAVAGCALAADLQHHSAIAAALADHQR